MKTSVYSAALAATGISLCGALSIPQNMKAGIEKQAGDSYGLPADGLVTNCVSIGFLPSEGDSSSGRYTMAQINNALGAKASAYGWYGQITSSSFDGSQFTAVMDDVKTSGAVFVASVMPSINFNQVSEDVANQVAAVMRKFTDQGIEVWLRYAHEMNWYVTDGTYHGTPSDFITSWKNIYNANCKDNDKVKCFWSPNRVGSVSDLQQWWPGEDVVDIVGIDCYPQSGEDTSDNSLFDKLYGDFYDTYSKAYNKPFAIGETGAGGDQKEGWLKQLVSQDRSKYPNYISMSWFEYDKEADFRIVMTDASTLEQTKKTLLSGSGTCAARGENSTTPSEPTQPSDTVSAVTLWQSSESTEE